MKNHFVKFAQCLGALVGMSIFSFLIYLAIMFVAAFLMKKNWWVLIAFWILGLPTLEFILQMSTALFAYVGHLTMRKNIVAKIIGFLISLYYLISTIYNAWFIEVEYDTREVCIALMACGIAIRIYYALLTLPFMKDDII